MSETTQIHPENMSIAESLASTESLTEVECTLSASESYVETLTFKQVPAQPWLTELVIKTQILNAKNPEEKRVKAHCCIDRAQMVELSNAIEDFLKSTGINRPAVSKASQDKEQ